MKNILRMALSLCFFFSINACEGDGWLEKQALGGNFSSNSIEGQPLRLLVVRNPLTYRRLEGMETGYEFELIQHFALDAGFKLQVKSFASRREMLKQMHRGQGDLAAARLTTDEALKSGLAVSPTYNQEKLSLICERQVDPQFTVLGTLKRDSQFRLGLSSTAVRSSWIVALKKEAPRLKLTSKREVTTSQLFRQIEKGHLDCAIADSLEAHFYLRFFKDLEVVQDIPPTLSYHFVVAKDRPALERQLRVWLTRAERRQILSQARTQYHDKVEELPAFATQQFLRDQKTIFPQYAALFHKHSRDFGVAWQLAAAVAYQESHWNSEAKSFTGVKGLMQLTQETAEHLGVEDRTNADQSIWGGIKYLKMLLNRQPRGLASKEKVALALATYNVGPAHMIDAQNLALSLGKDPYSWKDLKTVLPLLADKDYFDQLKYGPARGHEPVDFVQRVFAYLDLI